MAGYFGGRVDMVVNFIINTRLAMPVFLVAMLLSRFRGLSPCCNNGAGALSLG